MGACPDPRFGTLTLSMYPNLRLCDPHVLHSVDFPYLRTPKMKAKACRACLGVLISLRPKPGCFRPVIERLVSQLFLRTIAPASEDQQLTRSIVSSGGFGFISGRQFVHPSTGDEEARAVFEFVPMWLELAAPRDYETWAALREMLTEDYVAHDVKDMAAHTHDFGVDGFDEGESSAGEGSDTNSVDGEAVAIASVNEALVKSVGRAVFDQVMHECVRLLQSLDLSLVAAESNDPEQDDDATASTAQLHALLAEAGVSLEGVQPRFHKDFELFVNLADFLRFFTVNCKPNLLRRWLFDLTRAIMAQVHSAPYVSGLYKLLSSIVTIGRGVGWLKPSQGEVGSAWAQPAHRAQDVSVVHVAAMLQHAAQDELQRIHQLKDDMLIAVLEFVLAMPPQLMTWAEVQSAMRTALETGTSNMSLALTAVASLERWLHDAAADFQASLTQLLPLIGDLLSVASAGKQTSLTTGGGSNAGAPSDDQPAAYEAAMATTMTKSQRDAEKYRQRRNRLNRLYGSIFLRDPAVVLSAAQRGRGGRSGDFSSSKADQVRRADSTMLQHRVLKLLGTLGGSARHVAGDVSDLVRAGLSWTQDKLVHCVLPLARERVDVHLDTILPQVARMACANADRQTKVAACELLHSLTLYIVGLSATDPSAHGLQPLPGHKLSAAGSMAGVLRRLFPSLLRLAVDVEQVAAQLFEPLAMQLIRWYSGGARQHDEMEALLDAVVEAVCDANGALRTYAARCLAEFLKWAIKHSPVSNERSSDEQTAASQLANAQLESLMERLLAYMKQPSPYHRLGACMAFNYMYRYFREDDAVLERFGRSVFQHLRICLMRAVDDPPALRTAEIAAVAYDHLKRIVMRKHAVVLKQAPSGTSGSVEPDFMQSVWADCLSPSTQLRRRSMQLLEGLAAELGKKPGLARWVADCVGTPSDVVAIVLRTGMCRTQDGSGGSAVDLLQGAPDIACDGPDQFPMLLHRLQLANGALDTLQWMLARKVITLQDFTEAAEALAAPSQAKPSKGKRKRADDDSDTGPAVQAGLYESWLAAHAFPRRFREAIAAETPDQFQTVLFDALASSASQNVETTFQWSTLTPTELQRLLRERALFAVRTLSLLTTGFADCSNTASETLQKFSSVMGLHDRRMWRFLFTCMVVPWSVGIAATDTEAVESSLHMFRKFIRVALQSGGGRGGFQELFETVAVPELGMQGPFLPLALQPWKILRPDRAAITAARSSHIPRIGDGTAARGTNGHNMKTVLAATGSQRLLMLLAVAGAKPSLRTLHVGELPAPTFRQPVAAVASAVETTRGASGPGHHSDAVALLASALAHLAVEDAPESDTKDTTGVVSQVKLSSMRTALALGWGAGPTLVELMSSLLDPTVPDVMQSQHAMSESILHAQDAHTDFEASGLQCWGTYKQDLVKFLLSSALWPSVASVLLQTVAASSDNASDDRARSHATTILIALLEIAAAERCSTNIPMAAASAGLESGEGDDTSGMLIRFEERLLKAAAGKIVPVRAIMDAMGAHINQVIEALTVRSVGQAQQFKRFLRIVHAVCGVQPWCLAADCTGTAAVDALPDPVAKTVFSTCELIVNQQSDVDAVMAVVDLLQYALPGLAAGAPVPHSVVAPGFRQRAILKQCVDSVLSSIRRCVFPFQSTDLVSGMVA